MTHILQTLYLAVHVYTMTPIPTAAVTSSLPSIDITTIRMHFLEKKH